MSSRKIGYEILGKYWFWYKTWNNSNLVSAVAVADTAVADTESYHERFTCEPIVDQTTPDRNGT